MYNDLNEPSGGKHSQQEKHHNEQKTRLCVYIQDSLINIHVLSSSYSSLTYSTLEEEAVEVNLKENGVGHFQMKPSQFSMWIH